MKMMICEAIESGKRLEILTALQEKLAETIDGSESGRDIAALSRQLREVTAEIENLKSDTEAAAPKTVLELVRNKHKKEA